MKVILLKNIQSVGKQYEVINVADGHALNFLFPKKLAEAATEKALARLATLKASSEAEKNVQADLLLKSFNTLKDSKVTISKPANEKGHLFAGIDEAQIAEVVKAQTDIHLSTDFIELPKHIKEVGEHVITVSVRDQKTTFTLVVSAE